MRWSSGESVEAPDPITRWLRSSQTALFGRALWIFEGGFLRKLSIPGGRPEGEWALPNEEEAFRVAKVLRRLDEPQTFVPGFAVDRRRMLSFLCCVDADGALASAPLVFDPEAEQVWQVLAPSSPYSLVEPFKIRGFRKLAQRPASKRYVFVVVPFRGFTGQPGRIEVDLRARTFDWGGYTGATGAPIREGLVSVPHELDDLDGRATLTFRREQGNLVLASGGGMLGERPLAISIASAGPDVALPFAAMQGAARVDGAIVQDLVSVPGARRVSVWLP